MLMYEVLFSPCTYSFLSTMAYDEYMLRRKGIHSEYLTTAARHSEPPHGGVFIAVL